ncbi:unnamed protein product [Blepharisma stoltei]|uniref:Uncharacterized protein n=1 Tax=Blepharisma stoltei TaxID=1481888 RepID=A0AAU9J3J2_9CILI|nr:unnamed protein product [Blepharisma stoltei]
MHTQSTTLYTAPDQAMSLHVMAEQTEKQIQSAILDPPIQDTSLQVVKVQASQLQNKLQVCKKFELFSLLK